VGGTASTIASSQADPRGIGASAERVVWANHGIGATVGNISRIDYSSGSTTAVVWTSNQSSAYDLLITTSGAYWSRDAANGSVETRKHGVATGLTVAVDQASPGGIALDTDATVYWTYSNGIRMGRPSLPYETIATTTDTPAFVALDATNVYWTSTGATYRVTGGTAIQLATSLQSPRDIAVDDQFVYWTENVASGKVRKVVKQ
jgi:hypothetical protein